MPHTGFSKVFLSWVRPHTGPVTFPSGEIQLDDAVVLRKKKRKLQRLCREWRRHDGNEPPCDRGAAITREKKLLPMDDVNGREGREGGAEKKEGPASDEDPTHCQRWAAHSRLARACVRLIKMEHGVNPILLSDGQHWEALTKRISCGQVRSTIRAIFPQQLPTIVELSIKTSQKLEDSPCKFCQSGEDEILEEYKNRRFQPVEIDESHLSRFRRTLEKFIPLAWNRRKYPFIPNGHASLYSRRWEGGNWNEEPFEDYCRPLMVYSSGKPRVVTLYSSYNTEVLSPLHYSLYSCLSREGWLLVGPPTEERVVELGDGDFVSIDYKSATDNIKSAYVDAVVDALLRKGVDISFDQARCLRVLSELRFDSAGPTACSGQPMGSVMSFPMLCLINRTVVEMSVEDSFTEWSKHPPGVYKTNIPAQFFTVDVPATIKTKIRHSGSRRPPFPCLINGDDLLFRDPTRDHGIYRKIRCHGAAVGLVVNEEKTMVSATEAEINSTLFINCRLQKKTNLGALRLTSNVSDVLGFAAEATRTARGFISVVRRHALRLTAQEVKMQGPLPIPFRRRLITESLSSKTIRTALTTRCSRPRPAPNPFPVETVPDGYYLPREEEIEVIREEVARLREAGYKPDLLRKERYPKVRRCGEYSLCHALRVKKQESDETVLRVLARRFREKEWKGVSTLDGTDIWLATRADFERPSDLRPMEEIEAWCSVFSKERAGLLGPGDEMEDDFVENKDFIALI
jgi:hypothetical protein